MAAHRESYVKLRSLVGLPCPNRQEVFCFYEGTCGDGCALLRTRLGHNTVTLGDTMNRVHPSQMQWRHSPTRDHTVHAAWCETEEEVPATRQAVYDRLVETMGDDRTGDVRFFCWTGEAAANRADTLTWDREDDRYWCDIVDNLDEIGGWLVVALAPGKKRWGKNRRPLLGKSTLTVVP